MLSRTEANGLTSLIAMAQVSGQLPTERASELIDIVVREATPVCPPTPAHRLTDAELDRLASEGVHHTAAASEIRESRLAAAVHPNLAEIARLQKRAADLENAIAVSCAEMERAAMIDDATVLAFTVGVAMRRLTDAAKGLS